MTRGVWKKASSTPVREDGSVHRSGLNYDGRTCWPTITMVQVHVHIEHSVECHQQSEDGQNNVIAVAKPRGFVPAGRRWMKHEARNTDEMIHSSNQLWRRSGLGMRLGLVLVWHSKKDSN